MNRYIPLFTVVFLLLWPSFGFAGFADQSSKFSRERVATAKAKQTGFPNTRNQIRSAGEPRESNRSIRAFWLSGSDFTCELDFDLNFEIPLLVIITDIQQPGQIGALVSEFLTRLVAWKKRWGGLPTIDGIPCWDGPVRPPGNGGSGGGGGGVAAVPEPATLAVWGVLGLASTGAGYRRLRRKGVS